MKRNILLLCVIFSFFRGIAQPEMLKVIPNSSESFVQVGNVVFFASHDSLMKTDGTTVGTVLVKSGLSNPQNLWESNGLLYFVNASSQLWRSDGTTIGTFQLKSFSVGQIRFIQTVNSYLYFTAKEAATGNELYRTDGSTGETILLKDIYAGSGDGMVTSTYLQSGNMLYFQATTAANGKELWKTDGSTSGTELIKDVNPGTGSGYIAGPWLGNGKVYFAASDGTHGTELWKTDGTSMGTTLIKDVNPGSGNGLNHNEILSSGGWDYFVGNRNNDSLELWKTDGTTLGTSLVTTLYPSTIEWTFDFLYADDTYIYFALSDYMAYELTLWKSNGTSVGTTAYSLQEDLVIQNFGFKIFLNGKFYAGVYLSGDFLNLLVTDGTSEGSFHKAVIGYGDVNVFDANIVNDHIVFGATGQNGHFSGYYKSDGTYSGSSYFTGFNIVAPRQLVVINDKVYFATDDGPIDLGGALHAEDYNQLFESDLVNTRSLRTGCGMSLAGSNHLVKLNGKLIFTTYNNHPASNPHERVKKLWIYDPQHPCYTAGAGFTLVDADTDDDISGIANNAVLTIAPTTKINIRYNPTESPQSVSLYLNELLYTTQNTAPYALAGDNAGDYHAWTTYTESTYTLVAREYSGGGGSGTLLKSDTVVFTIDVLQPFIGGFTLIHANGSMTLLNGATIDLNSFTSPQVNIVADVEPEVTGSVRLNYNNGARTVVENQAPYSLFGDSNGIFYYGNLSLGTNTITAIPYTKTNASGIKGDSLTIQFTVVNHAGRKASGWSAGETSRVICSPNPASDFIQIQLNTEEASYVKLEIFDASGSLKETLYEGGVYNNKEFKTRWDVKNVHTGVYLLRVILDGKVYSEKLVVK